MDQTYSLHCTMSEYHLSFKVADGPDHILSVHIVYKNVIQPIFQSFLHKCVGFKVADGSDP